MGYGKIEKNKNSSKYIINQLKMVFQKEYIWPVKLVSSVIAIHPYYSSRIYIESLISGNLHHNMRHSTDVVN